MRVAFYPVNINHYPSPENAMVSDALITLRGSDAILNISDDPEVPSKLIVMHYNFPWSSQIDDIKRRCLVDITSETTEALLVQTEALHGHIYKVELGKWDIQYDALIGNTTCTAVVLSYEIQTR